MTGIDQILVTSGGISIGSDKKQYEINKVEKYETQTKKWLTLPQLLEPLWGHSSCIRNKTLYLFCVSKKWIISYMMNLAKGGIWKKNSPLVNLRANQMNILAAPFHDNDILLFNQSSKIVLIQMKLEKASIIKPANFNPTMDYNPPFVVSSSRIYTVSDQNQLCYFNGSEWYFL